MMKSKKNFISTFTTASLLLSLVFIYAACQTSTDPDPEPPIEPEPIERVGDKEFTITVVHRETGEELTGYNIEIEGPVTASESGVSESSFTLSDVVSGEYTITVSLDGFVTAGITEELEVSEEVSDAFSAVTTISLRQTTPPVTVNNNEDTTVKTGTPDEEDAEEDEAVSIQIPANTFPADVVEADGSVNISVTRSKPLAPEQTENGLTSEAITFAPTAQLNNPVTVTVPIRVVEGLEDLEYFLQPGNIPLIPDGNGNLVATITPDRSTFNGFGPAAEQNTSAEITNFRTYSVTSPNVTLSSTDSWSEYQTYKSACGQPLETIHELQGGVLLPFSITRYMFPPVISVRSAPVSLSSEPNRIVSVRVRNKIRTYRLEQNGNLIAEASVGLSYTEVTDPIREACHDSGGTN